MFHSLSWIDIRTLESTNHVPDVATLAPAKRKCWHLAYRFGMLSSFWMNGSGFYAESLKLQVTGTLGILLRARREGHITRVEPVLNHLKRLGFRLAAPTRERVLRLAGELPDAV